MDENTIRRVQPHNEKAEQGIVGTMLVNRDAISDLVDMLTGEDFYNKQYGILFDNMVELYSEGASVDPITLVERLRMKDIPEEVANTVTLAQLVQSAPLYAPVKDYAKIVKDKATLRQLIKLCENTEKDGYQSQEPVEVIMERAEQSIFKLVQNRNGSEDTVPIREIVMNVIREMEEAARNDGKVTGVPTGFRDLDNMLTGMHAGELLLVAARPAMGKTAFVLNIAHHLAVMKHIPVGFFSLEMSKEQLASRILAVDAMVDSKSMKVGDLSDDDWDKVIESTEAVANSPLYIEENSSVTISELRSIARKWKQNYGVQVIMIDSAVDEPKPCRGEPAAVYRGGFPCIEELGEGTEDSNYCIVAAFPCGRCKTGPQASAFGFARVWIYRTGCRCGYVYLSRRILQSGDNDKTADRGDHHCQAA